MIQLFSWLLVFTDGHTVDDVIYFKLVCCRSWETEATFFVEHSPAFVRFRAVLVAFVHLELLDQVVKCRRGFSVWHGTCADAADVVLHFLHRNLAQNRCILDPRNAMDVWCTSALIFNPLKMVFHLTEQWR